MKPERFLPSAIPQPHVYPGLYLRSGRILFLLLSPWIFSPLYLPILAVSFWQKCIIWSERLFANRDNYNQTYTRFPLTPANGLSEPWKNRPLYYDFSILAFCISGCADSLLPLTLRCALLGAVEITTGIGRSRLCSPADLPSYHSNRSLWWDFRNLSDKSVLKSADWPIRHYILEVSTASLCIGLCSVLFLKSKPADPGI